MLRPEVCDMMRLGLHDPNLARVLPGVIYDAIVPSAALRRPHRRAAAAPNLLERKRVYTVSFDRGNVTQEPTKWEQRGWSKNVFAYSAYCIKHIHAENGEFITLPKNATVQGPCVS